MPNTMNLLTQALQIKSAADWQRQLHLSRNALHTTKQRGNLSPAIAGALAQAMGQDVEKWIVVAALESERDSACKTLMLDRLRRMTAFYWCNFAHLPRPSWRWIWSRRQDTETPSISASTA